MIENISVNQGQWDYCDIEDILSNALAHKEALLAKHPKLKRLQEEIDSDLARATSLADRFYKMGVAHARYNDTKDPEPIQKWYATCRPGAN